MYSSKRSLMELFQTLFFLALVTNVLAAPAGKGNVTITTFGETTFASEPHGRGTVGILISCTATFIFCIWTAVHPNIVPGVKAGQRFYYKAVLMFVSILFPEGVLVCAMGEYRVARRLKKAWQLKHPEKDSRNMVDMQVAYFVVMGGFYVDVIDMRGKHQPGRILRMKNSLERKFHKSEELPPPRPHREILTPTGFKNYIKQGLIRKGSFDKAEIGDKGKASAFGKFLSAVQAFWLLVDCTTRWHAGLPLSLLEIHVIIHVVRTALIYAFWWHKPLDVNEPIKIKLFRSEKDEADESLHEEKKEMQVTDKDITASPVSSPHHSGISNFGLPSDESWSKKIEASKKYQPNEPNTLTIQSPQSLLSFNNKALYDIVIQIDSGERENRRDTYLGPGSKRSPKRGSGANGSARFSFGLFAEALLVCVTGALHAAAWNSQFPTHAERWLWRISALAMCFCCLGIFLIANFTEYEQDLIAVIWKSHLNDNGFWKSMRQVLRDIDEICRRHAGLPSEDDVAKALGYDSRKIKYVFHMCAVSLVLSFIVVYFCAVSYITVESYLSLREAPRAMFLTASWTDYWPHL